MSVKNALFPLKTNARDRLESHELLVVGVLPFGKAFAEVIAALKLEQARRRVVYTDELPLKRNDETRAAVDFICFVVSMQSKLSLDRVRESINAIVGEEQGYFVMGRWALVVLDSADPSKFAFTLEDVRGLSQEKAIPVLFGGSLRDSAALEFLANRVAVLLRRAARDRGISPLFQQSSFTRPAI
jgi:hypothetical protein